MGLFRDVSCELRSSEQRQISEKVVWQWVEWCDVMQVVSEGIG